MTTTLCRLSSPSISVSIWDITRSVTWNRLPAPHRGDGVDLVHEDDAGRGLPGLAERLPDRLLGLADPLAQELRSLDVDEVRLGLRGHRLGQHGLARAWRAVEQHALGRGGVHLLEQRPRTSAAIPPPPAAPAWPPPGRRSRPSGRWGTPRAPPAGWRAASPSARRRSRPW